MLAQDAAASALEAQEAVAQLAVLQEAEAQLAADQEAVAHDAADQEAFAHEASSLAWLAQLANAASGAVLTSVCRCLTAPCSPWSFCAFSRFSWRNNSHTALQILSSPGDGPKGWRSARTATLGDIADG